MKRIINIFAMAIMAVVTITFCSCGSDDDIVIPEPTEFSYTAPYSDWNGTIADVRKYMATKLPKLKEDEKPDVTPEGKKYYFNNELGNIVYDYTIKDDKLVESGVTYINMNNSFGIMKSEVEKTCGITEWNEHPKMGSISYWTSASKDQKSNVAIGTTGTGGTGMAYMYVLLHPINY